MPLDVEDLPGRPGNRTDGARVDIRARGFWTRQQDAFFDVWVTHPKEHLLSRSEILSQMKNCEKKKKRDYCARINRVDRGSFTPLIFSTSGLCAPECSRFLRSLASQLVAKHKDLHYSVVMGELRCLVSFTLLRWAITCFRGARASYRRRGGRQFVERCLALAR